MEPALEDKISDYARALELYYEGDWSRAEKIFETSTHCLRRLFY
jgi:hypothetical protein